MIGGMALAPGVHLKLVKEGNELPLDGSFDLNLEAYEGGIARARASAIVTALREGYTAVFDAIDLRDTPSSLLADLFERVFAVPVNINGYLAGARSPSFGVHWDDQEVVILHLLGRKSWSVEYPLRLSANRAAHGGKTSGDVAWAGELSPGQSMFIPRGWGHLATACDELSFHYTITIPRMTGLDALDGMLSRVRTSSPEATKWMALPLTPGSERLLGLPDLSESDRGLLAMAAAQRRFMIPRRQLGSVEAQMRFLSNRSQATLEVRCPCPGGWVLTSDESRASESAKHDGYIYAGMAGQLLGIPDRHIASVTSLTDGAIHRTDEAEGALVSDLIRVGLLEVLDDCQMLGVNRPGLVGGS
jgi:hypothetical protein